MGSSKKNKAFKHHHKSKLKPIDAIKSQSVYKRKNQYPVIPPSSSSLTEKDKNTFITLDNNDSLYKELISSSYKNLVVLKPPEFNPVFHDQFVKAFEKLEALNYFQYDYTQPQGLNSKIAKTYVTRCLVGIPGITYKYLGLRMFAHPWDSTSNSDDDYLQQIRECNNKLIKKTKMLLKNNTESGSCEYNLTLINRCYPDDGVEIKLKDEALYGGGKVSVSWHADSSLEHYSSIAVYHSLKDEIKDDVPWSIGCRVALDTEGPTAKTLSNVKGNSNGTPPIACPLPNNYTYFLLDDFNHHHQHTVLSGTAHRYASTHRVARWQGHNYQEILQRLLNVKNNNSKNSKNNSKQLRQELTVLVDAEFEWLRQFYIQGQIHYDLHEWWQDRMKKVNDLVGELILRIDKSINDLKIASNGSVQNLTFTIESITEQDEKRKAQKNLVKMKKNVENIESKSYDVMLEMIQDIEKKLKGWIHREKILNERTDFNQNTKPLVCPIDGNNGSIRLKRLKELQQVIIELPKWKLQFEETKQK